nr:MAG TPA_asm: hypothetical protein [Bacteriophage sp.]
MIILYSNSGTHLRSVLEVNCCDGCLFFYFNLGLYVYYK